MALTRPPPLFQPPARTNGGDGISTILVVESKVRHTSIFRFSSVISTAAVVVVGFVNSIYCSLSLESAFFIPL